MGKASLLLVDDDETVRTVAKRILDTWEVSQEKFVRVMPREYARALREQQQEGAVQEMSRVAP